MEVKVCFEDFDLEAEVDKAISEEINRMVGKKVRSMMEDNNISFKSITEQIDLTVDKQVTKMLNGQSQNFNKMIEKKIAYKVDREIDGIIRVKVAKIMSPYIKILEAKRNEISVHGGSGEDTTN